ncbi:glycosyltransferase family 2 protein [Sphingomonas qilianensis]|uniref:Glycosyltransferase family 2 protein n=1 Tax=Sphingomonas qilianensis TaxID=1736690 RepID=A0ABU9XRB5_9SPHN
MKFLPVFVQTLMRRPHRALGALFWYATGRRVRARNRLRMVAAQLPHAYQMWIDTIERRHEAVADAKTAAERWLRRPTFTIVISVSTADEHAAVLASLRSVQAQCLPDWAAIIVLAEGDRRSFPTSDARISVAEARAQDAAQALDMAIALARNDYIVPLAPGALLSPIALYRYAEAILAGDKPAILFGDHDEIEHRRRKRPWFKPQWNAEMFLAQDYVSPACAVHTADARAAGPIASDLADAALFALLLRVSGAASARIVHVPFVQVHLAQVLPDNQAARVRAAARHLVDARAIVSAGPHRSVRVQWPLPDPAPLVSIIVPTRDKEKLLRACVSGVLSGTRYRNFELLVVDNGSVEPDSLRYLDTIQEHPQVRVIPYDLPYNYSAINNFAVAQAQGDYLCLLNNDTEVLDEDWLTELMRQAVRPHVGAVGAKLLYDDGSIQHAGVIVGMGEAAGHAHRFLRQDDPGYFRQAHVPQYASAVTAACLVVARDKFLAVGGLDEERLQIAFNDVDLCLKLDREGWRNVYAPAAVMIHHESKSRGKDHSPAHIDRYMRELGVLQQRWGTKTHADPSHHPNLERSSETFVIRL